MNESSVYVLCNCSCLGQFSVSINPVNITTPDLAALMASNSEYLKISNAEDLFKIDFNKNFFITQYSNANSV